MSIRSWRKKEVSCNKLKKFRHKFHINFQVDYEKFHKSMKNKTWYAYTCEIQINYHTRLTKEILQLILGLDEIPKDHFLIGPYLISTEEEFLINLNRLILIREKEKETPVQTYFTNLPINVHFKIMGYFNFNYDNIKDYCLYDYKLNKLLTNGKSPFWKKVLYCEC